MKTIAFGRCTALLCLIPFHAFAAQPVVEKSSGSGFTPPEWASSESCRLFADRVEIVRTHGEAKVTEVRTIKADNLEALVSLALKERVKKTPNLICDLPTTTISFRAPNLAAKQVLFYTGSCGAEREMREGPGSTSLRAFVDHYCPTTHGEDMD